MRAGWLALATLFVAALPAPAGAQELPPGFRGGQFLESQYDSLSYDGYRELGEADQRERRDRARRFLRTAREEENPRRAVHLAATAVGLCPYLPQAWQVYGQELHRLGRYRDALAALDQLERTLPYERDEDDQRGLRSLLHGGRATALYNEDRREESLAAVDLALEITPGDPEWILLKARLLGELGRPAEGRSLLARIDRRSLHYSRALAVRALLQRREGALEASELSFREAYKYGMRGPVFENDWGLLLLDMGRNMEAVEHFEAAIESDADFVEARNNLAVALRRGGRLGEAERALEDALERLPRYGAGHFNLAELLRERRDALEGPARREAERRALEGYDNALKLGYEPGLVVERRALLLASADSLAAAEDELLGLAGDPGVDGRVIFVLGHVKKRQGELRVADRLFAMAQERGYDQHDLYSAWGEVALRSGDYARARGLLEAALERQGDLVVTRANLAVALTQLGEIDRAIAVLRQASLLDPDHPLVRRQLRQLEELKAEGGN